MNQNQETCKREDSTKALCMAMELSDGKWKLAFGTDARAKIRLYIVDARDLTATKYKIKRALERFKLSPDTPVVSCYEAGRDGFWIHRWLQSLGIINRIVDSSSVEVNRRKRRAKTDRIDARKLVQGLLRYIKGDKGVWSVLRVPSREQEDGRRLHRELERLKKERNSHSNRIRSLLMLQGIKVTRGIGGHQWEAYIDSIRCWDGKALPAAVKSEILRQSKRLDQAREQIRQLEQEQRQAIAQPETEAFFKIKKLIRLKGIGVQGSWLFVHEMFGWREFRNRRQVGSFPGLTGTPYSSGDTQRELGISKAGNRRVRKMAVEIGWCWLRFQPQSKLSKWFQERFGGGGKRMRRIGIVALARKLLIDLWRYLEHDQVPSGAILDTK